MTGQAPLVVSQDEHLAATAAGSDAEQALFEAPFDGTVSAATYTPDLAITGVNTNTRKVEVYNRKQDGSGTSLVASLQFDLGTNGVKFDELSLTLGAGTNVAVATGDVISIKSTHVGTGISDPGGRVRVEFTRTV